MIPWDQVDTDSERAWMKLAGQLVEAALTALRQEDGSIDAVLTDLEEFIERPSFAKPQAAMASVGQAHGQLTRFKVDAALKNLEDRNALADDVAVRMKLTAAELKNDANLLRLRPVQDALAAATLIVGQVKAVEAEVKKLPKDDVIGRLAGIADAVQKLVEQLGQAARPA